MNKPEYIIVHHTGGSDANPLLDSSNTTFEAVNFQHKNDPNINLGYPSSLGYYIAYHYFIDRNGNVKQGRADTDEGAHTKGYNSKSIGICLAGNFDRAVGPTDAQKIALQTLLKRLVAQYSVPASNIVPHRKFASKTCYGKLLSDTWASELVADSCEQEKAGLQKIIDTLLQLITQLLTRK